MNILLDTHIAVWAFLDEGNLPQKAREIILNPSNTIFYSPVSTWEIHLKHRRNPENMMMDARIFIDYCHETGFTPLLLSDEHVIALTTLYRQENAPEHKDPFDRILLAQAKAENIYFLTHDNKFVWYNEPYVICV